MSSDESSSSLEFQECILKCKEAKEFFNFPTKAVMRTVWLYKLGLHDDEFYPHPTVCDRHFSDKMFDSDNKLKSTAVPDINLPNELTLNKGTKDETQIIAPVQPGRRRNAGKKITKVVNISRVQSNTSRPDTNSPVLANPPSTMSWIDDSSNILVDYQLKVGGKHMCDVVEIPQFIVVFTVVKAKQTNLIQLSDIQNNKNKANTTKRPSLKNLPKPTAFITIDDEDVILPDSVPLGTIPAKPLEIIPQELPAAHTKALEIVQPALPAVLNKPLENVQPALPAVSNKPLEIVQPELSAVRTKPLEVIQPVLKHLEIVQQEYLIIQPELPTVQTKPLEIAQPEVDPHKAQRIARPKRKSEPEIQTVYYTTDEGALPRRDRSIQVDLCNKRRETGIQCDVQMDNDIREMSCSGELYWVQSRFKRKNPQINLDECLVCGEILSNYASKVKHAYGHEESPSLCSKCGLIFDNQIKLKIHEKTFHSNNLNPWKPQRCPKRNCTKAFRSKNLLINHIEEHIQTKQHKCNKCLQFFSSSMKLSCHQRALDKCLRTRGWTSKRWTKRI